MSNSIYASEADVLRILAAIKDKYSKTKCYGEISFKEKLPSTNEKAVISFTTHAWSKVIALVDGFSTEVQWHGLVSRKSKSEFQVFDIVVFPQQVSGVRVTSEDEEYNKWISELDDDTFYHLKFHGHSHVNMPCGPSSTDMEYRHNIVGNIPKPIDNEDSFYIFMIFNKRREFTGEIYDVTNNVLYENADITLKTPLDDWMVEAKKQVSEIKSTVPESKIAITSYVSKDNGNKKSQSKVNDNHHSKLWEEYRSYWDSDDWEKRS